MRGASDKRERSRRGELTLDQIHTLRTREAREQSGLFFAEGVRFLAEAVHHRHAIETLVVAPSLLTNTFGRSLVRRLRNAGVPCLEVSEGEFRSVALTDPPQGVGLVVRQRWEQLARIRPESELCWVALESVRSPGNLGSIIRTSEAVGAAGVILLGDAIDPFDPVTVRASMGAIFAQRLVRATAGQFVAWKRHHSVTLIGTAPTASVDYQDAVYGHPLVLLMGGERKGLPAQLQALCDVMVKVPMVGCADSLNLATATAVMLYEAFNQRRHGWIGEARRLDVNRRRSDMCQILVDSDSEHMCLLVYPPGMRSVEYLRRVDHDLSSLHVRRGSHVLASPTRRSSNGASS